MARAESTVSFRTEVFAPDAYAQTAAQRISESSPSSGAVVITGGTTAALVYEHLDPPSSDIDVFFSDERCVPPDDDASNFKMATETFLSSGEARIHRMRGELPPDEAAALYHGEIAPFVDEGIDLMLLGMGADCHIGALYPNSPALKETLYCAAVDRPDGLAGLTLTPPAMRAARRVLVLVTGAAKKAAVSRVLDGTESVGTCPARLLADLPAVTFLLDEPAAGA
jgi:6-phosphogluconolactonase